jgi:hypothetical protein
MEIKTEIKLSKEELIELIKEKYQIEGLQSNTLTYDEWTAKHEQQCPIHDVSGLLQPITPMSREDSYRYHTMCARATLYPNKTIEEVRVIIEDTISKWNKQ